MIIEKQETNPRCDRCGAKAVWLASLLHGPLYLCNHHLYKFKDSLIKAASSVVKVKV